jgi:hypothetical protein
MSLMPELPESSAPPSLASLPRRAPRWRRALLYVFALIGVLAVGVVGWVYYQSRAPRGIDPASVSMDELIDQTMAKHYGLYVANLKGWVQVDPQSHASYLTRVIHRVKMEAQDTSGHTVLDAVYFLASGERLGAQGMQARRLGLFLFRPDASSRTPKLIEVADPHHQIYTLSAVRPEDVRFEALSSDTFGWVVKLVRAADAAPTSRFITNLVLAPRGDGFAELASFPARAEYSLEIGCARAAAEYRMAQDQAVREQQARGARAASGASEAEEDEEEGPHHANEEDEGPGVDMCSDATWTYKTGDVGDGFVDLIVSGGGLVNGQQIPKKTYKLIFDPKSNSYVVPDELNVF